MATPTKTVPYTIYLPENIVAETPGIPVPNQGEIEIAGLVFTGRETLDYGQYRNQNFLSLLANFASPEGSPGVPDSNVISNALVGQIWYNQTSGELLVFDGASWVGATSSLAASDVTVSPSVAGAANTQDALEGLETLINDHIADTTDAHDATAISFDDSGVSFTAANVQLALAELDDDIQNHIADASDAHDASAISFAAYLTITSSDVQAAIQELKDEVDAIAGGSIAASAVTVSPTVNGDNNVQDALESINSEIDNHIADTVDAHDASAISVSPSVQGGSNVQDALEGLDAAISGGGGTISDTGTTTAFTPNARTLISLSNPIAGTPDILQIIIVCQIADVGYSPGDVVMLNAQGNQLDEGSGPSQEYNTVYYDTSVNQIKVILNYSKIAQPYVANASTPTSTSNGVPITPARWQGFVKAIEF